MMLALYGGLARLGLPLPSVSRLESLHGPLMICGVLGTLISLERAVAIGLTWPFLAPACFASAALLMIFGASIDAAAVLALAGSAVFLSASIWIVAQQRALFTAVLVLAALMLLVGCALWLGGVEVRALVGWWLGFLVCTIAAERLELSRVVRQTRFAQWLFVVAVSLILIGAAIGFDDVSGGKALGTGFFSVAAWMVRYDVAGRTIRMRGQPRFMAAAMLAGYLWLGVAGLALLLVPGGPFTYDLTLHAVLIGFVLSMVFGHALIIFPAVTGVRLQYRPVLYLPLALLHISVALRVGGDLLEVATIRLASGPLTAGALIVFAGIVAFSRRTRRLPTRVPSLTPIGDKNGHS